MGSTDEHAHALTGSIAQQRLAAGPPPPADSPRLGLLPALLGAAWLVPITLHLLRLDAAQPVLLLLAVAAVLRAGTNVIDRFMIAAGLLAGAVLALGLLFSVWPWGLQPVPAGGACFSLVALTGWLARRRPSLPRRWLGSDVLVLGSGLLAFLVAYAPISGLSPAKRLAFSAITSDRFRHFALYDTIHRLGGYAFLHQQQARLSVPAPMQVIYPSGSHFLLALLDTFLRSTTDPGTPLPEFSRYFVYMLAGYAFLITAIVWAARWVAGPRMAGWRRFVICSAVAALAISAPLADTFILGLDSDILGLAFLALAVALTVRPPRLVTEQVLIVCSLLIAVAYSYNIFAIPLVLGMAAAGIVYRRRLRRERRFTAATLIAGGAIACYPSVLSLASGINAQSHALATTGWVVPLPGALVGGLALVFIAAMISVGSRRLPAWRAMTAQLLAVIGVIGTFAVFQLIEIGRTSYYFNKLMMAGYLVCVIGLGAAGSFLRPVHAQVRQMGQPSRMREAGLAVAAGVAAMGLVTMFQSGLSGESPLPWAGSRLANWSSAKVTASAAPSLIALAEAGLPSGNVPTLVLLRNTRTDEYADAYAAVVNRDYGLMRGTFNAVNYALITGLRDHLPRDRAEFLAAEEALRKGPFPLRIVVADEGLAGKLRALVAAYPGVSGTVQVQVLPALHGSRR